jgi:3-hydroxyacyl-[acyl-carrier-protein] dehydratase
VTSRAVSIDILPHRPPMRLIEEIADLVPGESARGLRVAHPDDWYFQGHFPDDPIVPAMVLVELVAQIGGVAAASTADELAATPRLRVAAVGPFKFPGSARPRQILDARARVVARIGGMFKIEGQVLADGACVAIGSVTLADVQDRKRQPVENDRTIT